MPVNLSPPGRLLPIAGVRLTTAAAGIRYSGRQDLAILELAEGSVAAGLFTQNAFCAAPVSLCRQHLQQSGGQIRGLLINSGNANAGTGSAGMDAARESCAALAAELACAGEQILPFSTGVIGERFPVERLCAALPEATSRFSDTGWLDAAQAIMTTDTVPKAASREVQLGSGTIKLTGIAKGAGMIRPDMATMLAFIACDAALAASDAQTLLHRAVANSFNRITVDGDTSTNDAAILVATGQSGIAVQAGSADREALALALDDLCRELAQALIRDAEGATRFVTVVVEEARDGAEAAEVAYTIAHSPLVKTALYAGDPNWGRILAAVGRSGLTNLNIDTVRLALDDVAVLTAGQPDPGYSEAQGQAVVKREEFRITVGLGRGTASHEIWTSDFSTEYVRINAEYRS